jgi:hypothetical protein
MFNNSDPHCKEHGTSDNTPRPTVMRSDTHPKLSLLNPDDIPPIRKLRICRHGKKPNTAIPQAQLQLSEPEPKPVIPYISPPTSSSDTDLEVSTSSARSGTTDSQDSQDTQYSSSQRHYYRNRDKILTYAKLRYKNNRDALLAYSKKYQSERKTVVKERNVTYYEANRLRLLKDRATKITCECGKVIAKGSLSNHMNTAYHLRRVATAPTDIDIPCM